MPDLTYPQRRILALASALAVIVGCMIPWGTVQGVFGISVDVNAFEEGGDGPLYLIFAVLVAVAAIIPPRRWVPYVAAPVALLLALAVLSTISDLNDAVADMNAEEDYVHVTMGLGAWVTLLGWVGLFIAAVYAARTPKPEPVSPWAPPVVPEETA